MLLSSILQLLHLEALRGGAGVWTTPVKTFHTAVSLSLSLLLSLSSVLLIHYSSVRIVVRRRAALDWVLYDVQESRLRDGNREAKQTNIQKGATPALLNKTKRRATAKFA